MTTLQKRKVKKHEEVLHWIGVVFILPMIVYLYGLMLGKGTIPMELSFISAVIGLVMMIYFGRKKLFAGMGKDGIYHPIHRGKYVKRKASYRGDEKVIQADIELTNCDPRGKLESGKEYDVEVFVEDKNSYAIAMLNGTKYNAKFFRF